MKNMHKKRTAKGSPYVLVGNAALGVPLPSAKDSPYIFFCAVSDVRSSALIRVSEFTSDNVARERRHCVVARVRRHCVVERVQRHAQLQKCPFHAVP